MTPPGAAVDPVVDGPRLVSEMPAGAEGALAALWTAVTRAGGAVGFPADAPESEIRAAAELAIADVRAGRQQLIALTADGELAGVVFLRRGTGSVVAHRAEVLRLMVRPDLQGRGWGGALLDAAIASAAAAGLEQLLLSARGGTALPDFYRSQGWTQVGVFPGALRLGPDDLRDEHWFQRRLS